MDFLTHPRLLPLLERLRDIPREEWTVRDQLEELAALNRRERERQTKESESKKQS